MAAVASAVAVGAVGLCVAWMIYAGGPVRVGAPRQGPNAPLASPEAPPAAVIALPAPVDRADGSETAAAPPSGPTRVASLEPAVGAGETGVALPAAEGEPVTDGEAVGALALSQKPDARRKGGTAGRGVTILQIGDSHTSADFFTADLRKVLQARYGDGGPGYVTAGHPHIGVRSASLNITSSPGWSYKALQRSDSIAEFWLSGFNSVAVAEGQAMSFSASHPVTFDMIEIEVVRQPGGGAIDIRLDGVVESKFDLDAAEIDPVVIRLLPNRGATDRVRQISVTTTRAGAVSLASVAIYNRRSGVTYNSVGYPGATVGIINKFDDRLFASELGRIDPQIVVLSFGSNEGFNDNLDLGRYAASYERAVQKIRTTLPAASIVVIAPPDGNELPGDCRDKPRSQCRRGAASRPAPPAAAASADGAPEAGEPVECAWRTPPKLDRVRDIQRDIAQRDGLVYWDWASIMPRECGADRWASQSPPLMAKDHLHFTGSGYKLSADQFAKTLIPVIEKVRASANAVPDN
jgi:lysophospholipase L1-like esterase